MKQPDATRDLVGSLMDHRVSRRQFIQRALALGFSASGAGALLAACDSSSSKSVSGASAGGKKNLTGRIQILVGFGTGNAPDQVKVQQALAEAFTRKHTGVTIDFLRVPDSAEARTKLTVLISGGQAPDLVMPAGIYGISLFVDQKIWLDLGPLLKRDGLTLDNFVSQTAPATHVSNYYGKDSQAVVGVPVGVHDHALAYNADLFAKAGLKPPPSSWKDDSWRLQTSFLDAATALTRDKNGRTPADSGFDAGNIDRYGLGHFFREAIFYDFGGHLYDRATRQAQFNAAGSVAGIAFAADLVNKYHVQPSQTQVAALGAGGGKGNEEQFAWRSGKLAMIDMCSCDIRSPFGTKVPFEWKAAALPAGPARRFGFLNLDVAAIVAQSKHHDLAWEVLKYFTFDAAVERQLSFDSYGAIAPLGTNDDAFPAGIQRQLPAVDPSVWIDGLAFAAAENEEWFPAFAEVNDLIGKAFDEVISGQATAATAMAALQKAAQPKIDLWFKTHKLPS